MFKKEEMNSLDDIKVIFKYLWSKEFIFSFRGFFKLLWGCTSIPPLSPDIVTKIKNVILEGGGAGGGGIIKSILVVLYTPRNIWSYSNWIWNSSTIPWKFPNKI